MAIHTTRTLLTQREAARLLGISERRILDLRRSGDISVFPTENNNVLITADSVRRYARLGRRGGRPYSAQMAFGALYMVSHEAVPWLSAQQRYRLRRYLHSATVESLVDLTRRRAQVHEYWCRDSRLDSVRKYIRISAATDELSNQFNLVRNGIVEGYVNRSTVDRLVAECRMKSGTDPITVRLRISDDFPPAMDGQSEMPAAMPWGVCAADLAESDDPRERRAGMEMLVQLLHDFNKNDAGRSRDYRWATSRDD